MDLVSFWMFLDIFFVFLTPADISYFCALVWFWMCGLCFWMCVLLGFHYCSACLGTPIFVGCALVFLDIMMIQSFRAPPNSRLSVSFIGAQVLGFPCLLGTPNWFFLFGDTYSDPSTTHPISTHCPTGLGASRQAVRSWSDGRCAEDTHPLQAVGMQGWRPGPLGCTAAIRPMGQQPSQDPVTSSSRPY